MPAVSPEPIVGLLTVSVPPSVSVSLPSTSIFVAFVVDLIVTASSTATGASFAAVTVMVMVPVSVREPSETV